MHEHTPSILGSSHHALTRYSKCSQMHHVCDSISLSLSLSLSLCCNLLRNILNILRHLYVHAVSPCEYPLFRLHDVVAYGCCNWALHVISEPWLHALTWLTPETVVAYVCCSWALHIICTLTAPQLMKGLEQRYIANVRKKGKTADLTSPESRKQAAGTYKWACDGKLRDCACADIQHVEKILSTGTCA